MGLCYHLLLTSLERLIYLIFQTPSPLVIGKTITARIRRSTPGSYLFDPSTRAVGLTLNQHLLRLKVPPIVSFRFRVTRSFDTLLNVSIYFCIVHRTPFGLFLHKKASQASGNKVVLLYGCVFRLVTAYRKYTCYCYMPGL